MQTESLPVYPLESPEEGLAVEYQGFVLQERKADGPMTEDDLMAIVAQGEAPVAGAVIPADAEYESFTVQGSPAVGVTFRYAPGATVGGQKVSEQVTIFVLELDGVDVRFESMGGMKYVGAGEQYEPFYALTPAELADIAETLEPVE